MAGGKGAVVNSRAKGVRGELEVAHLFQKYGYKAERGVQHDGRSGHADVEGVPYIWIEVKRDEDLNLEQAMLQAERDNSARRRNTGEILLPVVVHKRNRMPWYCTMRLIDFLELFGVAPFELEIAGNGKVTMLFDDWVKVFIKYEVERRER